MQHLSKPLCANWRLYSPSLSTWYIFNTVVHKNQQADEEQLTDSTQHRVSDLSFALRPTSSHIICISQLFHLLAANDLFHSQALFLILSLFLHVVLGEETDVLEFQAKFTSPGNSTTCSFFSPPPPPPPDSSCRFRWVFRPWNGGGWSAIFTARYESSESPSHSGEFPICMWDDCPQKKEKERNERRRKEEKSRIAAQLSLETGLDVITWELIKNFPLWGTIIWIRCCVQPQTQGIFWPRDLGSKHRLGWLIVIIGMTEEGGVPSYFQSIINSQHQAEKQEGKLTRLDQSTALDQLVNGKNWQWVAKTKSLRIDHLKKYMWFYSANKILRSP